jgi:hypothetical protein
LQKYMNLDRISVSTNTTLSNSTNLID